MAETQLGEPLAVYRLPLAQNDRRSEQIVGSAGLIVGTAGGKPYSPADLPRDLAQTDVVLLGEIHADRGHHEAQLDLLHALHGSGRPSILAVEMLSVESQPSLDLWLRRQLSDAEFLDQVHWQRDWRYAWSLYEPVFRFARDVGIPIVAIDAPQSWIKAVKAGGLRSIPSAAGALRENVRTGNSDYGLLLESFFKPIDSTRRALPPVPWESILAVHRMRDAAMAMNLKSVAKSDSEPSALVVALVGLAHVAYGLGVEYQLAGTRRETSVKSLVFVSLDPASPGGTAVSAPVADYVWFVAAHKHNQRPN